MKENDLKEIQNVIEKSNEKLHLHPKVEPSNNFKEAWLQLARIVADAGVEQGPVEELIKLFKEAGFLK